MTERYSPRPVRFIGHRERAGWRLNLYGITYGDAPIDRAVFESGLHLALADLPSAGTSPHRPDVGFLILHQGRGVQYPVACWWNNENELPIQVWVRPMSPDAVWQRSDENESVCVWDLEVIAFERDSYVQHVLSKSGSPDLDGYIASVFPHAS